MKDYYSILGVNPDDGFNVLKKAYYRRALECHPDRFGGSPSKAENFKSLVEAFNVLSDPPRRARYDVSRGLQESAGRETLFECDDIDGEDPVLDTLADDILEEMIVGNTIPRDTTLQTLLMDLERTERFCMFREGKNLFYSGRVKQAGSVFSAYIEHSPGNILAHYFLGQCFVRQRRHRQAASEYLEAIRIGAGRHPPLRVPRIRNELGRLMREKVGLIARLRALCAGTGELEPLSPEEEARRQVNRAIRNILKEERRLRRSLYP